ncbi:MAG TPA: ABC transporter substrate-binding protein [Ferrovibrio sp.]|uniref:ABC transporter substrate-binding protein n=1 Tax=Ferrovibrio sp. TaxID=1917215 RepID=UPI002B4B3291|nr:ABC transporter substrate-binding protein [Ferrovibrio sp.]HLT76613.1 ABC transporter substrate-binding protein [Ferrovibrio sp.]
MTKLTRRQFAAGTVAGAALFAGSGPFNIVRAQGAKLRIGSIHPRSGYQAQLGLACQRGIDIAPRVLKQLGMGADIEIMSADTESNVDVARSRAEKLINDGANVLIGAFDSGQSAAIAQVAEQKGVPYIINVAAAPQITEQGYKFVFRNFPTAPMLVGDGLNLMKGVFEKSGITPKTAVFMHVNDTFGQSMAGAIKAMAPRFNLPFQIVETIAYDPQAKDLSVEIAKAKATGAEMLMPVTRLNDAILMVREMVKQRWEPKIVMSPGAPGFYEGQFYKTLGKFSNGMITNVPWYNPRSQLTQKLLDEFTKTYKNEMFELNVGFSFEAVMVAADAFNRAKSTDGKALADAIRQTRIENHVMAGGTLQFNEKGQNVNIKSVTLQNLDQRPKVVLPLDIAEDNLLLPLPSWSKR